MDNLAEKHDGLFRNEWKQFRKYGPSARSRYRILTKLIYQYTDGAHEIKILDCGCGTGDLICALSNLGYTNLSGSDFSKESISCTQERVKHSDVELQNLFCADLTKDTDFPDTKYDLITCSEVLEHIPDHDAAAKTLHALLRDNGILIVSVPFLMSNWSSHDDVAHVRRYEPNELESLLQLNGFTILRSWVWGALFYELYSRLLTRIPPKKVMISGDPSFIKRFVCSLLYKSFYVDDYITTKARGRRIFVVARKN